MRVLGVLNPKDWFSTDPLHEWHAIPVTKPGHFSMHGLGKTRRPPLGFACLSLLPFPCVGLIVPNQIPPRHVCFPDKTHCSRRFLRSSQYCTSGSFPHPCTNRAWRPKAVRPQGQTGRSLHEGWHRRSPRRGVSPVLRAGSTHARTQ